MKATTMTTALLTLTALLFVTAEAEAALADLKAVYQKKLTSIEEETSQRRESYKKLYSKKLHQLEETETSEGDLEAVLVVRKEKKRFSEQPVISETVIVPKPYPLRKLQMAYRKAVLDLPVSKAKRILTLATRYDAALKRLQIKLTQKDAIDAAIAVKAERKALPQRPEILKARDTVAGNATEPEVEDEMRLNSGVATATKAPSAPVLYDTPEKRADARTTGDLDSATSQTIVLAASKERSGVADKGEPTKRLLTAERTSKLAAKPQQRRAPASPDSIVMDSKEGHGDANLDLGSAHSLRGRNEVTQADAEADGEARAKAEDPDDFETAYPVDEATWEADLEKALKSALAR